MTNGIFLLSYMHAETRRFIAVCDKNKRKGNLREVNELFIL